MWDEIFNEKINKISWNFQSFQGPAFEIFSENFSYYINKQR